MTFAAHLLSKIQEQRILVEADSVRFHKIGDEVFEIAIDGRSFLLSTDAGLDLSFRLAEFLSSMEQCRP
jgi:hypothetical protein